MDDYQPGSVKQNPETKAVAIRTAPSVTAGPWFVFDPENGGHYTTEFEAADWVDMVTA